MALSLSQILSVLEKFVQTHHQTATRHTYCYCYLKLLRKSKNVLFCFYNYLHYKYLNYKYYNIML